MKAKTSQMDYSKVVLWRTRIAPGERLKIVNPGDFPKDSILKGLGIDRSPLARSFGISNREEIVQRHALVGFLLKNPKFAKFIQKMDSFSLIPTEGQDFLNYYDPEASHNPHWQNIHRFLDVLKGSEELPIRLEEVVNVLKQRLPEEETEKKMGESVAEELKKISAIEGLFSFRLSYDEKKKKEKLSLYLTGKAHVHGHQLYSFDLNQARLQPYPAWTENWWHPGYWTGIGIIKKWFVDRANRKETKRACQEMVIDSTSEPLCDDIEAAVLQRLRELNLEELSSFAEKNGMKIDGSILKVYFSYSKAGLMMHIYAIDPYVVRVLAGPQFDHDGFAGYTEEQMAQIGIARTKYQEIVGQDRQLMKTILFRNEIRKYKDNFFDEIFRAPCPRIDTYYRWFAISNILATSRFRRTYGQSKEHRKFFYRHIETLKRVLELTAILSEKAKELKTTLCIPEVVGDREHVVAFDEIFPIHLLSRLNGEKPIPIRRLPEINSTMVGFTGAHGGGKTVAALSITDNIFLAQSGLPLFGSGFRFNVKGMLGMVFIERGEGSTCELLLKKIKNVLRSIKRVDGRRVVLVLDEVGTGTQEADGFELGKDLLSKLSESGTSVLFSTQITQLAEVARSAFNACCFRFDRKHRISAGIGTGGMKQLRREMGLNRLLR